MPTLLRIDSSPLTADASFSRQLTAEFVEKWRERHPDGRVITRDLATTKLPPVTAEWIRANFTAPDHAVLEASNDLIAELNAADEYVFGVAMHNFSVPSVLKLWIDQIVRIGKTIAYENGARTGLLGNKKATFLVASGGAYEPGTPTAALNFVEPYLRAIFGFLGVADISFIYAAGTARSMAGVDRATILEPALASIHAQV